MKPTVPREPRIRRATCSPETGWATATTPIPTRATTTADTTTTDPRAAGTGMTTPAGGTTTDIGVGVAQADGGWRFPSASGGTTRRIISPISPGMTRSGARGTPSIPGSDGGCLRFAGPAPASTTATPIPPTIPILRTTATAIATTGPGPAIRAAAGLYTDPDTDVRIPRSGRFATRKLPGERLSRARREPLPALPSRTSRTGRHRPAARHAGPA